MNHKCDTLKRRPGLPWWSSVKESTCQHRGREITHELSRVTLRQFCSLHNIHPSSNYPIYFCQFFTPVQAHLKNAKLMVQVARISKSMRLPPDTYHTLACFSCSFPTNNWCPNTPHHVTSPSTYGVPLLSAGLHATLS